MSLAFVNSKSGDLEARCVGCPSSGQFHDGQSQADLVFNSLMAHPCQITRAGLRSRLAACGGDGAITRGGPQAKHSSTKSAEIVWSSCKGSEPVTVWGLFHRSDIAQNAAAENSLATIARTVTVAATRQQVGELTHAQQTGKLTLIGEPIKAPMPVCVKFVQ